MNSIPVYEIKFVAASSLFYGFTDLQRSYAGTLVTHEFSEGHRLLISLRGLLADLANRSIHIPEEFRERCERLGLDELYVDLDH